MTFEDWLKSIGIDPASVKPEGMAALQLAYESAQSATPAPMASAAPAQGTPAAPVVAPVATAAVAIDLKAQLADFRKQMADEAKRVSQIQDISKGYPNITASAIEQNWSAEKVELEVLKASQARTRPTSFVSSQNDPKNAPQVLEAAVCMHRRIKTTEKDYSDQVLQAAHSKYRNGIGLQQLVIMAAAANGMYLEPGMRFSNSNGREILMNACGKNIQAAFSTVNLSGILSNVANKELLQGYMEEDNSWREIAAIKSVSDFKAVTSYRMLDNMEYEQLGAGGKIKHGTIGEESYTRQVNTYAKMFAITRTDIINDDMGAFDDLRNRVGRGSAKRLGKVFWTKFVNNSTFFTTARTNYFEGATSNLGTDGVGLGLGVKAFRNMKTPAADGEKAIGAGGGRPEILLVPPTLESIAEQLYQARNLTAVKASDANIYAGKYKPVIAWQLEDSDYTGYSTTAWYLLASPSYLPTMVVSFLNGQETPTVESADADFDTLGIQFRGYHDFGCDQAEYLGGVKSKGAA
jgi:phage major head subunit gpT-like protein